MSDAELPDDAVRGEVTEHPYHLTQAVADGDIEGEPYTIGLDVGSGSVIINFTDREEKVTYSLGDLLTAAYHLLEQGEDQ